MWFGESEANVRDVFDKARAACVPFALAKSHELTSNLAALPLCFSSTNSIRSPSPVVVEEEMLEELETVSSTRSSPRWTE